MKDHYDFSKAKRGLLYAGKGPLNVRVFDSAAEAAPSHFEVIAEGTTSFRFRLVENDRVVFTSEPMPSREACLGAIEALRLAFAAPVLT
ncbi:MAG: YegP family protein [Spirochaetales bacterium]